MIPLMQQGQFGRTAGGGSDPYFSNVILLLHGEGANGSTTITDSSPAARACTASGNAQISTAQAKFGGSSIAFDGTGDSVLCADTPDITHAGDFTFEAWVRVPNLTGLKAIFSFAGPTNWELYLSAAVLVLYGGGDRITGATSLTTNTWNHVAWTRSGTTHRIFVNGVSQGTYTDAGASIASTGGVTLGAYINGTTDALNGHLDEVRITNGVARYTANFTPPTAAFPDA